APLSKALAETRITMDYWIHYLFAEHSESELKDWASRLQFFRYRRAYGGHANDGDSLDVALKYDSTKMLVDILRYLGIEPTVYSDKPKQPTPSTSYTYEEYCSFPSLISGTKWVEQPSYCNIDGIKVHISCEREIIKISLNHQDKYTVTTEDIECAEKLERKLGELKQHIVDPPRDIKHYVCPKYYPDIFS
ncbi:hypothetical protein, partial [Vibrio genomosp. F10]|uniref:hypothetical protein n=1 Tax=Vibrio genomosp. F10 TaxID=723171 RepID=UPI001A7E0A46